MALLSMADRHKRVEVGQWFEREAISLDEAKARKLVPLSNVVFLQRWENRIELFEFAKQAAQAAPVLVITRKGRACLYTEKR